MLNASLGMEIKLNRIAKKLSQKKLAEYIGISSQYLCAIEADKKIPTYPIVERLQEFFPSAPILEHYNSVV